MTVLSNVDVYDPAANTWTQLDPMPTPLTHMGAAVDGRDIYLASGYVGLEGGGQTFATTEVWKFNVDSQVWTEMPPLPEARGSGGLAVLDRDMHFFGGSDARRRDTSDHWVLDLDNQAAGWRNTGSPLVPARNHLSALTLDGKIYAIGGQQGQDERSTTLSLVSSWDPQTSEWSEVASLSNPLSHISAAAFVMDGRIIVAGGEIRHNVPVAEVWAYDPSEDAWTALTDLPVKRRSGVAEAIGNEIIFTTGGAPGFSDATYRGVPAAP
ncbi:hypothetical protein BH24BAC1_BH24BAC1_36290 [soil metagenome]